MSFKPAPIFSDMKVSSPGAMAPYFNKKNVRIAEIPSCNASCSARGMAKLATCLVQGGELDGVRIMSRDSVEAMCSDSTKKPLYGMMGAIAEFSQGGVNYFRYIIIN